MSKGQSEIMEYMIMVLLIVGAIIGIMLFLAWWGGQQVKAEGFSNQQDRIVSIAQVLMADYMFVDGDSMFSDAKLTALNSTISCEELQDVLGAGWYITVKALDMPGNVPCSWNGYPDCNYWAICPYKKEHMGQKFPVNVHRIVSDTVALGVLEVGVYT
jgi:hypothetical protein